MPAIQLARLRLQAAQVAASFYEPPLLVRQLHDLLDFYADRTHKPGQAGAPAPLIRPYHAPKPVLRHVTAELAGPAAADPPAALLLADALWSEPYLEFRLLAAAMLGQLPPEASESTLRRVNQWVTPGCEDSLLDALVERSLAALRRNRPERYLQAVENWLAGGGPFFPRLALKALPPIISDTRYENLPVFFRILSPFIWSVSLDLRPFVIDAFAALAHRSPNETAYFFIQNLDVSGSPGAAWYARQVLPHFPQDVRDRLRPQLRLGSAGIKSG